jgi:hypothetical protein
MNKIPQWIPIFYTVFTGFALWGFLVNEGPVDPWATFWMIVWGGAAIAAFAGNVAITKAINAILIAGAALVVFLGFSLAGNSPDMSLGFMIIGAGMGIPLIFAHKRLRKLTQ